MPEFRICLDVDDTEKAVTFYTRVCGLKVGRRFDDKWVELTGGPCAIDLLENRPGSHPTPDPAASRDYRRHWTPVHIDFPVSDIHEAIRRALEAGAVLEEGPEDEPYGRLAQLSDPFGHGFCFLEFRGRGYDEILTS